MIAKVIREMQDEEGVILDVDTVYKRLSDVYGDDVFQSERMLAQIAVRQKIKSHLKNAYSINGDDSGQLQLIKDDAPAALAVKQPGGGYAYVPLRVAGIQDLDAATKAKVDNIKNAQASLRRWEKSVKPIRAVMEAEGVTFGEAQKMIADRTAATPSAARKRRAG
jgi:hypothetical protein